MLRSIIKGVKNLWYFRKVIWEFRPYDYSFNLELFRKSLVLTAKQLEKGITQSGPQDAKDIREFLELTDDRTFLDVSPEYKEYINKLTWKFSTIKDKPDLEEVHIVNNSNITDQRATILTKRSQKWEQARWNRAMTILKNKMQGWWD